MNLIVPYLNCWAVVAVRWHNLSAILFCVNPYLCHLPVNLDDHCTEKVWGRKSAVPRHFVNGIETFNNSVLTELDVHNSVVFIDQPLLGGDKATADLLAHLVPELAEKGSSQNVSMKARWSPGLPKNGNMHTFRTSISGYL